MRTGPALLGDFGPATGEVALRPKPHGPVRDNVRYQGRVMQSLVEFYAEDPRRRSREIHLGVGWRSRHYGFFEFSLFWIADTKELCVLRAPTRDVGPRGSFSPFSWPVPLYSQIQPPKEKELTVEVLGVLEETEVLEALEDWEEHVDDPGGLEWVKQRVATGNPTGPAARPSET